MRLEEFNALPAEAAAEAMMRCCGCAPLSASLVAARPFASVRALQAAARITFLRDTPVTGWLEALSNHPRIGGDVAALRERFRATAGWAEGEQSAAMASADEAVLRELAEWNTLFEQRFGHVFVICATGVPAGVVLAELKRRYGSAPHAELRAAADEQAKITALRVDKLFGVSDAVSAAERRVSAVAKQVAPAPASGAPARSPITTHVLDQARGAPAVGVAITLERRGADGAFALVGEGATNSDGRLPGLLPAGAPLQAGVYRITFQAGEYEARASGGRSAGFYPEAAIVFEVRPDQTAQHFHVPLLLSPYGYSTYRGS